MLAFAGASKVRDAVDRRVVAGVRDRVRQQERELRELRQRNATLVEGLPRGRDLRLEFRSAPKIGANAFVLPDGLVVGENADEDARRFYRSEQGIVLVTQEMLARL